METILAAIARRLDEIEARLRRIERACGAPLSAPALHVGPPPGLAAAEVPEVTVEIPVPSVTAGQPVFLYRGGPERGRFQTLAF